jgi:hypothetical protein
VSRLRALATFAALMGGACGIDGSKPIDRDRCAASGGTLLECGPGPLASAEDACWRLVQCGSIPAANPALDPTLGFDWAACVEHVEYLPDDQFESALACVEAARCDELRVRGGPGHLGDLPACLDH